MGLACIRACPRPCAWDRGRAAPGCAVAPASSPPAPGASPPHPSRGEARQKCNRFVAYAKGTAAKSIPEERFTGTACGEKIYK